MDTNDVPLGEDPFGPPTAGPEVPIVMEFRYDALGRRVETLEYVDAATGAAMDGEGTNPSPRLTRHVYAGLEMIQEYVCELSPAGDQGGSCEAGPALVREYVHGDPDRYPEPIAMLSYMHELTPTQPGDPPVPPIPHLQKVYHYLHDALGSVIGVVDDAGALVERTTYDPYGKPFIEKWDATANGGEGDFVASTEPTSGLPVSSIANPFGFTGHRYDAAAGLNHTLFRSYDPSLGRWLQRDPIEYFAGTLNLFEYVASGPVNRIDPLGLKLIIDPQGKKDSGLLDRVIKALGQICPCYEYTEDPERPGQINKNKAACFIGGDNDEDKNERKRKFKDCLRQNKAGCKLVRDIIENKRDVFLRRTRGYYDQRSNIIDGKIIIWWKPGSSLNETNPDNTIRKLAPPFINLSHELVHGWDALNGGFDKTLLGKVEVAETRAVRGENQVRREYLGAITEFR